MYREDITETFSDSDLRALLDCSKELLSIVDEIIEVIPITQFPSAKQKALRLLFMDTRTASYDIRVLVESLLDNKSHHFSRAIEFSIRFIWEKAINYFYISEVDNPITNPVAQRYLDFLDVVNTDGDDERKERHKAFKEKYENTDRGDYWSGQSREDKIIQGLSKQPNGQMQVDNVKNLFGYLNEHVHGNLLVGSYWDFDKYGRFEYEHRGQIVAGLLNLYIFYAVSNAYCKFTGRGNEVERFKIYESRVKPIFFKSRQAAADTSQNF